MNDLRLIGALASPARAPIGRHAIAAHVVRILAVLLFAALVLGARPAPIESCASGVAAVCGP